MSKENFQAPRGTADILPSQQKYWQFLKKIVNEKAQGFGFERIETPIFEYADLFIHSIGEETDIVQKEMFIVSRLKQELNEETENKTMVLRPEGTPNVVRAYLEHGMQTWPQPVKLYYLGPMFRSERPQKGRLRQFHQFGFEIIGDNNPYTDALLILLIWQILEELGIQKEITLYLNSIGCPICRPKLRKRTVQYYSQYRQHLCVDCQRRLITNPLRLYDCKNEQCQKITASAPQILDNLCRECKDHFKNVLEYLDDLNISYEINPYLIRGLDYYTRTTFEITDKKDPSRQASLGGGGRYDSLVEELGGIPTPAIGAAFGMERLIEKIKELNIEIPELSTTQILVIQLGEKAKKQALSLVSRLNGMGYSTGMALGKVSLKAQLRAANKMGVRFALIIGQREAYDSTVMIRDMMEGSQETITFTEMEKILFKKLKNE